ncbi:MAG: chemotaxis protein CheR [Desulfobacterales bacterium]|nr:chemotaxis protein CheR [Desulfobacterales bacterium]MBF0396656.1 chemotaxis protein CheR [Desulfobacterales bacterium]
MAFTYFFRDMQTLEMIRDYALPVLKTRRFIHIWDAGCAMGPEAYTLAIILRENMGHMMFRNVKIHATDIEESDSFGKIIQEGIYPEEQVKRIPKDIFEKYFEKTDKPGYFRLIEEIRKCIDFQRHDLLSLKPIRKDFGLILCKNVLLHFKENERIDVIKMYHDCLTEDGFFVTEHTQKMPSELSGLFQQVVPNAQVFRKVKK